MPKKPIFARTGYAILDRMKGGRKGRGFTVIETLIVLTISAGLFASVALTLSGKQNATQFQQAIQDMQSRLQQVINDVSVGYYPNMNNFSCSPGALGPLITSGAAAQGTNSGCVFLGKAIQFGINGTNPEQYRVFTVAGLQKDSTGNEVTSYANARPLVVAPSTTNGSIPDSSEQGTLNNGLTTGEVYYGSPKTNIGAVAFVNSLASYSSGAIVSGSEQVNVVPIANSALNVASTQAATNINNNLGSSPVNPSSGVNICFVSGTTKQIGIITIGSNGRQLNVTLAIKGGTTCP